MNHSTTQSDHSSNMNEPEVPSKKQPQATVTTVFISGSKKTEDISRRGDIVANGKTKAGFRPSQKICARKLESRGISLLQIRDRDGTVLFEASNNPAEEQDTSRRSFRNRQVQPQLAFA